MSANQLAFTLLLVCSILALSNCSNQDRVFHKRRMSILSLVELPKPFIALESMSGDYCKSGLDCFEELPRIPPFLKFGNFKSVFKIHTKATQEEGITIQLGEYLHEQLQDVGTKPIGQNRNDIKLLRTSDDIKRDSKIVKKVTYPFDLSLLEDVGFDPTENTRIIIGGYLSHEERSHWKHHTSRMYRKLEPNCNIINFSWQDGNRGLYPEAAFNSRIAGRQLSVLLYYLDQLYGLDYNKVHIIGHSLGAHIAGFVGADFGGKFARITGLDPAGPIFYGLDEKFRLSSNKAKFVDIHHTNWGQLISGCFGIETPDGHIDYYYNGKPTQPGCNISMLGFELLMGTAAYDSTCSHRRAIEYFTELLGITIIGGDAKLPYASLFTVANESELGKSEIVADFVNKLSHSEHNMKVPIKYQLEVHKMQPEFPQNQRGLYMVYTEPHPPYFL